ncbi:MULTISPECIES: DivIVA domain-containing protein [Caproicibacterium]|uniref:DivIVA domain-containing protein n=1 Tax=Caproicibacterium argilliputei TaxID=3030016 RepID=A0AA97H2N2_9FIRM|nr:DivIVA domain-containing protein [Caproicibacterium argilliputei]WOC31323.1 DivIVA domain-containing protein [Caproicibacterium argilliputei]
MLSLNDIKHKRFQKASLRGGYMREEVDDFLDEVEASYDALIQKTADQHDELERKEAQNRQLKEKIKDLEGQIDKFRKEEDEIKEALVSAQKMRDAAVREARHQAEAILNDANLKAKGIVSGAEKEITGEQQKLQQMKQAVSDFRAHLLDLYKEQIALINNLPQQPIKQPEAEEEPAAEERPEPSEQAETEDQPPVKTGAVKERPDEEEEILEPVTFASPDGEAEYLTAKPFAPVRPEKESKASVIFGEEYDLDDDDASQIFNRKH